MGCGSGSSSGGQTAILSPEEATKAILTTPVVSAFPLFDGNGIYPHNLGRNERYARAIREAREIGCPGVIHEIVFTGYYCHYISHSG